MISTLSKKIEKVEVKGTHMERMRDASIAAYASLCDLIPGGVNSPVRSCKAVGLSPPMVAESGKGDQIYDVDGHAYIDYCGSWGALIHGHAHPAILKAAIEQMAKGTSFGITTAIEGKLAGKMLDLVDSVEQIRFVSSGTEAAMSAVRLARGFTGKEYVVKFAGHFHGHADFFLIQAGSGLLDLSPTSSSAGVPPELVKQMICAPFNDLEGCRQIFQDPRYRHNIAAVILEPIAGNMGVVPSHPDFMAFLRQETERMGALLILDEVITGFRVSRKGAQGVYGVWPDLTVFGKVMGGGFPAAAFGGRKEIMQMLAPLGPVYQAGTLSGNPVAMAAGLEALTLLQEDHFYAALEEKTRRLTDPISAYFKSKNIPACIQRAGSMFTLFLGQREVRDVEDAKKCDRDWFGRFFRYLFHHGIYIPPLQQEAWFISSAHTEEHLDKTSRIILDFFVNPHQESIPSPKTS